MKQPVASEELVFVVDIGNTTVSAILFKGETILDTDKILVEDLREEIDFQEFFVPMFGLYEKLQCSVICSVVPQLETRIYRILARYASGSLISVSSEMRLPFTFHYDSPLSFGNDRLALCAWCAVRFANTAVIAIDIGTAITIDVLNAKHTYLGGLIMPGLTLMARALDTNTAQVTFMDDFELPKTLLGTSTETCVNNGIVLGCVAALNGIIEQLKTWLTYKKHETALVVLLTGGNAALLKPLLCHHVILDDYAVAQGARFLALTNVHKEQM